MPSKGRELTEPFSPASRSNEDLERIHAICDAYRAVKKQFAQYAQGRILGQSFLLAGHRGSGKTTLAHLAIQAVANEATAAITPIAKEEVRRHVPELRPESQSYHAIPFLVPLHGPDLLPGTAYTRNEDTIRSAQHHITRAFHRALCQEVVRRFEGATGAEQHELCADLKVQLDRAPEVHLLRGYWERICRLERGVIPVPPERQMGQGFREIVAVYTAILAAQKCTSSEEPAGQANLHLVEPPSGMRSKGMPVDQAIRLGAPVLSLLAGAFAANSVADTLGPLSTGAVAVATVLLAYSFLAGAGRSLADHTLAVDSSIQTLDLLLPVLVERAFDAGLAPIFVVDELDKVDGFEGKIDEFIRKLKYFVTDRAMFCFLADRSYYENLQAKLTKSSYPVESTYFADRLLIYFTPDELRGFLKAASGYSESLEQALVPQARPAGAHPADPADKASLESARAAEPETLFGEKDVPPFTYLLLLFQSRCHLAELRRIMALHSDDKGAFTFSGTIPTSVFAVPGYRLAAFFQVAIEQTVAGADLLLRQEKAVTQWLLDALYGVARLWEEGAKEGVDIKWEDFFAGLRQRASGGEEADSTLGPLIEGQLRRSVKELLSYLEEPLVLRSRFPDSDLRSRIAEHTHPLIRRHSSTDKISFEWFFDEFGTPQGRVDHGREAEGWTANVTKAMYVKQKHPEIDALLELLHGTHLQTFWNEFQRDRRRDLARALAVEWIVGGPLQDCRQAVQEDGLDWVGAQLSSKSPKDRDAVLAFLRKEPTRYDELLDLIRPLKHV